MTNPQITKIFVYRHYDYTWFEKIEELDFISRLNAM
jgi:hypothetical protein